MNTPIIPLFLTMLSCMPGTLTSAAISESACPPSTLSVRLPPYLDPALNGSNPSSHSHNASTFLAPPTSFYTGTWYQTNSSLAAYRSLSNMQWDVRPVLPSCVANTTAACPPGTLEGTMADLTTWALNPSSGNSSSSNSSTPNYNFGARGGGNRPVASFFGHDIPRRLSTPTLGPAWDGVWTNQVVGEVAGRYSEGWSVLYWGEDAKGFPFLIVHETNPPCVDAFTRSPYGPDAGSLAQVMDALVRLGNEELTELVEGLGPIEWDHGLGVGAAICGESCQANKAE